ncbi:galectin-7 [Equus caballus]|uniref:Galectin n=1 Tax=Equus caballus TaxID=9796 RepID=F6UBS9_HORSE|nr:galectin-7 [Equus caballus]
MEGSTEVQPRVPLPEGIRVGNVMRIRGVVPGNAHHFSINLVCKEGQDGEVALHFNPRLEESIVVFNTMQEGRWGREERGQGIPFQRGQPFDVLIITTEDGFKAVVGDSEYYHFRHRIPPANVRLLEVGGDPQVDSVKVF